MDKETYLINSLKNRFIGDDGAVVGKYVYSKDIFAQDVHFKLSWMSLTQIARKAMLVNISDAIAMNAKPLYALIGVTIPKNFSFDKLKELSCGFSKICKEWDMELIGGDTVSGKSLIISITIISKTKNPVFRKGMKSGDLVAYTGEIGQSLKGLNRLLRGGKLAKHHRFLEPTLRSKFFYEIAPFVTSALDLSDGLGKDLSRLSKINSLRFKFFKKIPKDKFCSGEEYEMLFSFNPKHKSKIQQIAKKHKTPLNIIAYTKKGKFKSPCKEHHF